MKRRFELQGHQKTNKQKTKKLWVSGITTQPPIKDHPKSNPKRPSVKEGWQLVRGSFTPKRKAVLKFGLEKGAGVNDGDLSSVLTCCKF